MRARIKMAKLRAPILRLLKLIAGDGEFVHHNANTWSLPCPVCGCPSYIAFLNVDGDECAYECFLCGATALGLDHRGESVVRRAVQS
jgi:hypothetical protein